MPIRLIKVSKNLNVGINSLVEFLHKKGIEIEANPNAKIEDEQYDILIAEFGKDKNIRREATETREKMHRRDEKRETVAIEGYELPVEPAPKKKVEKETIETEIPKELKPHFNVVGSIDLDNLHKKKTESKQEEIITVAQPETEILPETEIISEEPVEITPEPQTPKEQEIIHEPVMEEPEVPETVEEKTPVIAKEQPVTHEVEVEEEEGIPAVEPQKIEDIEPEITTETEETPQTEEDTLTETAEKENIVVKGSIDLDAINDRTRPPRKSRAQRKKERLEREQKAIDSKRLKEEKVKILKKEAIDEKKKQPAIPDADDESKKRKRTRIRSAKVNIDKPGAVGQPPRGERKPALRKPIKAEVSEEDVQKQIKETLARLTEKRGKKGGAK